MQKFLLYDTDEGLDFNISCVPTDLPWVSCRVFQIQDEYGAYFELIKAEEYFVTDLLKEYSMGTFTSFQQAVQSADLIARIHRIRNRWPEMKRIVQ